MKFLDSKTVLNQFVCDGITHTDDSCQNILKLVFFLLVLHQIYKSPLLDPDVNVSTLLAKVEWDISFYFARRDMTIFPS